MTKKAIIQLKAILLLLVFFLNTAVGIACALAPHDCCHKKDKPNCCNESVLKFQQLDKSFEQQLKTAIAMPLVFISGHFVSPAVINAYYPYPVIRQYVPPRDIRVSIRSFQI